MYIYTPYYDYNVNSLHAETNLSILNKSVVINTE